MRITEAQLRRFIRESMLSEISDEALMVPPEDRYKNLAMDPETKQRVSDAMISVGEAAIDFTKSIGEMIIDLNVYFKSGQVWIDAVRGLTGVDLTPENEREWRATIAAASLHDFLDKFGTAGVDAADLINAFLYTLEGNWKMAGICSIAAIPAVGSVIKGEAKFAIKAAEDVAAVDAGISRVKQGFKASGLDGSDKVIAEIDKIRAEMGRKTADFSPYDQIPAERMQAVKEVAKDPQKLEQAKQVLTRQQQAYQDLRSAAKQNIEEFSEDDPRRYADTSWERTAASNAAEKADYPQGRGGIVPQLLSPGKWRAGKDILEAWLKNADHTFFKNEVKKVHWLGFSRAEQSRTAVQALQDFLADAPFSKNVQISTVGYLEDLNPGPRAGVSFREGLEGAQVQVGIKLKGDTTLATTHDAYTTNRGSIAKAQTIGARAGQVPPPAFEKVPRADLVRKYELARETHPLYDPELRAAYDKEYEAAEELARKNPGTYPTSYMDPSWKSVITATPETLSSTGTPSLLMLDKQSWREPFTGDRLYNEVILDSWEPEAIILNPKSATLEQIKQIKALADEAGLPLLDTDEQLIRLEDFAQSDRAHAPARVAASPKSTSSFSPIRGDGKAGPIERATDDEMLPMDDRARQYEGIQLRWGKLAGLLKG